MVAGSVGPYGACQHDGSEYNGNYVDHMTIEVRTPRGGGVAASFISLQVSSSEWFSFFCPGIKIMAQTKNGSISRSWC